MKYRLGKELLCGNCLYFHVSEPRKNYDGLCRKNSPGRNGFGQTYDNWWCGEYGPNEEMEEKIREAKAQEQAEQLAELSRQVKSFAEAVSIKEEKDVH